jgi:hypothetical protein
MTQQRDLEQILDQWFTDGPNAATDRVIYAVADRIERQPQRPAWRLFLRETHVTTYFMPLAAVAAALVVAVIGLVLVVGLMSRSGVAGPSPSARPTAQAFACYGDTTGCAGPLPAGEHASTQFLLTLTFTTPDGWVNVRDIRRTYGLETNGLAAKIEVMGLNAIAEQTDACGPVRKAGVGSSVRDLIAAVKSHPGLVAADPVPAEVDGFKGQSIDFVMAATWDKKCPEVDPLNPVVLLLTDSGEPPGRAISYGADQRVRWTVIDVDGEAVIIELVGPLAESQFESSIAADQAIIDSFKFSLGN